MPTADKIWDFCATEKTLAKPDRLLRMLCVYSMPILPSSRLAWLDTHFLTETPRTHGNANDGTKTDSRLST